ncbi:MAG: dephospho-CoA kinase [Mariniphaga sp.]
MMRKIGITGGIGSGKTTVCEIFKLLGIPIFHADQEAKYLQNNDLIIKNQIIKLFGEDIYTSEEILDRQKLATIIFNNKQALFAINEIIHPAVRQRFQNWTEKFQAVPYSLYEAAILFESGYASDFDLNILVLANEKLRIERVINRDGTTEEIVKQRIRNQIPDNEKIKLADFIIENNADNLLIPQILKIDKLIREDGKTW